jgi:hypothetical protein
MEDKAAKPGWAWPAPEMAENRGADTIADLVAERRTNGTAVLRLTVAAEADLAVAVAMAERFIESEVVQKSKQLRLCSCSPMAQDGLPPPENAGHQDS